MLKKILKGAGFYILPLIFLCGITFAKDFRLTLGIYIAADNDLAANADLDLEEIRSAQISQDVNVVVFADRGFMSTEPGTCIFIKRDTFLIRLEVFGNLDSGDPGTLSFFVNYMKTRFPSENYGLVLWGHGTGWLKSALLDKNVSYDASSGNSIDVYNGELKLAIPDSLFSFILFDACLMGSIEVLWELKGKFQYVLASPALVPVSGFNYKKFIECFSNNESIQDLLKRVVDGYVDEYSSMGLSIAFSLYDISKVDETKQILESVVNESYFRSMTELRKYRSKTLTYNFYSNEVIDTSAFYIDLVDFLRKMGIFSLPIVVYSRGSGVFSEVSYLSVYFPLQYSLLERDFSKYRQLAFQRSVNFLDLVLNALESEIPEKDSLRVEVKKDSRGTIFYFPDLIKAQRWRAELILEKENSKVFTVTSYTNRFLAKITPGTYKLSVKIYTKEGRELEITPSPEVVVIDSTHTPYVNNVVDFLEGGYDPLGRKSKPFQKGLRFKEGKKYIVF